MTRKTSRSRSTPDAPKPRRPRKAAKESAAKESAAKAAKPTKKASGAGEETPATSEETPARAADKPATKVSLPAFGFAEDLLREVKSETEPAAPAEEVAEADPRRIFAFADSLDRGDAETEIEAAPVRLETWVAFSLAGEVFALPVAPIREVVRVASITRVPHAPKPIRGVTNRRGRVIPVIDLRLRIELPETELSRASRIIVVSSRRRLLGLLVDAVHQVVHIDLEKVQPPPDDVMTVQSDYLSGVYHLDDQLILLLDIDRALIIRQVAESASAAVAPPEREASAESSAGPA